MLRRQFGGELDAYLIRRRQRNELSRVRDVLKVGGAEMQEADNAETGFRMIDAQNFDAVLMHLRMPGTDGLTATLVNPGTVRLKGKAPHYRYHCRYHARTRCCVYRWQC